ncbi:type IV secretory system conjugative DNA transfer family protein [Christensenellaceae bacterium OttesenSCG-928-K19]|nr:type IV secretory system conjugative DNA transfer family protein [Christensenellaceae bacterium OttesenSCG-928-K19]
MEKKSLRSTLILWGVLLLGMMWFAAKLAMSYRAGMPIDEFSEALTQNCIRVFRFEVADSTAAFLMVTLVIWLVVLANYLLRIGNFMHGKEHGSAQFGSVAALQKKYRQDENIILSQNIRLGLDMYAHQRNLNVLVIGGSGSGKTRFYSLPNILNGNCSFVITDPKGEAARSVGAALEQMGYTVRVLNLIDMKNSHRYNPFAYIRKDDDIISLITNFIKNTTPPNAQHSDPFWQKAEESLLQALMFFLWYEAPVYEQTMSMVADMLRYAEVKEKDESYKNPLDQLFDELRQKKPEHIAVKQYDLFKLAAGKTAKSILVTAGVRLALFNIPEVARLTSEDELDFAELGRKKVAIFCVTSDNDSSFNFLASMMYSQMFKELFYQADFIERGRLKKHVRFILDEFSNISISGSGDSTGGDFPKVLSVCRSRNLSMNIIIQNIAQLKGLYRDTWENITGNCDTLIYLGGNEQSTHKYISDELGKATIKYDTYGKSSQNLNTNINITGRELLTSSEVRLLKRDECLVLISNEPAVKDKKYDLMAHPKIGLTQMGGAAPYVFDREQYEKKLEGRCG